MASRDWKSISRLVADTHNQEGSSNTVLSAPQFQWEQQSQSAILQFEHPQLEIDSNVISPKQIRSFLWTHRKERSVNRDRAVIWTRHSENKTTIGLGAFTHEDAKERYA